MDLFSATRQILEKIELVSLIKTQCWPGWPNADYIITAIKLFTSFNKFIQVKLAIFIIIVKLIPCHHNMHNIRMTYPFQIFSFKKTIIKFLHIIQHSSLENLSQCILP